MALFQQKDYAAAATHLEKTLALGLEDAHLHNFLESATARPIACRKPIHEHQRAIELDPKLAEAHLNLAYAYQRMGKLSEARAEYAAACKLEAKFCGAAQLQSKPAGA